MRPAALLLAALVGLTLVAAGCGGSSEGDKDGMTQFEHDGVSLSYPASWSRDSDTEKQEASNGLVLLAKGESGVEGVPYRLSVFDQPREDPTVRSMGKFVVQVRISDLNGTPVEDGAAKVPGTPEAWRVVTDYRAIPDGGGDAVPGRWIDLVWNAGDRQIGVRLTGPRDKMDAPAVDEVLQSVRAG